MPVAQQPSHHHHHHLFSSIGTFLHALQPSGGSFAAPSASSSSSSLSGHGAPDLHHAFESQLAKRLSSHLAEEDSPSSHLSLASLTQLMGLLLATQTDFRTLFPAWHKQTISMPEFLQRIIKLLDVCRGIKEQMLEVESLHSMLHLVTFCLDSGNGDLNQARVNRARKALAHLILHIEVEREDQTDHVQTHRSFRGMLRERLGGHGSREWSPHRWRSWQWNHAASHGNPGSASSSAGHNNHVPAHGNSASALGNVSAHANHWAMPLLHGNHGGAHGAAGSVVHAGGNLGSQALHTLEPSLLPPRYPPKDEEECFSAALYALNVVSIFCLSTISAALPSFGKIHSAGILQPPHTALWASPFLRLQDKVDEELGKRSKKHGGYAGMWELDQISFLTRRLFDIISADDFLKLDDNKEEVKKVVKMFGRHAEDLERDMGTLHSQINEFYSRVVGARMAVLDMLSDVNS